MASFLQNQPVQFTPYTPQYNTELYGQIGTMKQEQYNTGVQRSQGYIDSVAGLQVGTDADKAYLQQRLSEVTSKANVLASSDFSDQTIPGQIESVAAGVANDKIIQTAVQSTRAYAKESAARDKAREEGKDDPANSLRFNKQASAWLNSATPGTVFNGRYTPYRDVNKKALEIIKAVDPDTKLTQMPYQTDENGKMIMDKEGHPQLNTAMIERYYKGKDKDRIMQALDSGLDAGDYDQLAMNGEYKYQGATPDQLAGSINNTFADAQKLLADRKISLTTQLTTAKSPEDKQYLEQQLADLDQKGTNLLQDHQSTLKTLAEDPDRVRGTIYMQGWKNSMAAGFSGAESWTKYQSNPLYQAWWEQEKQNETNQKWTADHLLAINKDRRDEEQNSRDAQKFALQAAGLWKGGGKQGTGEGITAAGDGRIGAPIEAQTDPLYHENALISEQDSALQQRDSVNEQLALQALAQQPQYASMNVDQRRQEIARMARDSGTDAKSLYAHWASVFQEQYKKDNKQVPFHLRDIFERKQELDTEIENNHQVIKQADDKFGGGITRLINSVPNKNIIYTTTKDGKPAGAIELDRKDVVDLAMVWKNRDVNSASVIGQLGRVNSFGYTKDADLEKMGEAAKKRLIQKIGADAFGKIMGQVNSRAGGFEMNPLASTWTNAMQVEQTKASNPVIDLIRKGIAPHIDKNTINQATARAEWFRDHSKVSQPFRDIVTRPNGEEKDAINSKVYAIAERSLQMAGGNESTDFDYDKLKKSIEEDGSRIDVHTIPPAGPNTAYQFELEIIRKDGDTRKMTISSDEASQLTGKQYNFNNSPVVKRVQFNPKNNSTNYVYDAYSTDAWKSPYYAQSRFKTNRYAVSADAVAKGNDLYNIILHVKENGSQEFKNLVVPTNFTPEQIETVINSVNDGFIDNLRKDPNAQ